MGKVIGINDSPVAKMRQELEQEKKRNEKITAELIRTKNKIARLVSVNEMLKIQLSDLVSNINVLIHHLNSVQHNATILRDKLPEINTRTKSVRTQDRNKKPDDDKDPPKKDK